MSVLSETVEVDFLNTAHFFKSQSILISPKQELLVESIGTCNEHQFACVLEDFRINPDQKLHCLEGLSTFEKVLKTPGSRKLIEQCVDYGSGFYKVRRTTS